jgi:hypothetical protein
VRLVLLKTPFASFSASASAFSLAFLASFYCKKVPNELSSICGFAGNSCITAGVPLSIVGFVTANDCVHPIILFILYISAIILTV